MHNRTYWWLRNVFVGPFLWVYNRPFASGLDKIPASGPVVLASNHLAVMDSLYLPLLSKRQLTFLAKKEYFTTPGFAGRIQKWFFSSVGQVPVDRGDKSQRDAALHTALRVLEKGDPLGMYPEGTRSPDGRLYRGKTGMARMALESGAPVYPVAMINTQKANHAGSWILRPYRVGVIVGDPVDPADFHVEGDPYASARGLTNYVMERIAELSGQEYVEDFYAADVKKSLAAGEGYPEGSEPGRGVVLGRRPRPRFLRYRL